MKFGKLIIHNIASIEDAEIDFAGDVLGREALFLIGGETGAGKSTILDSICLALYSTTPRMEASRSGKYNINTDRETTITDPRQLLRRATGEGFAQFSFTGTDGKRYTARWSAQRARKKTAGKMQPARRELVCHDTHVTLDKSAAIDDEIRQNAVGLTFQQFCRTVMLAQGQFDLFLTGGEKEKSEILEKLTDTARYSEIGWRIGERCTAAKRALELAQSEMQGIVTLDDEQLAQLQSRLEQAERQQRELAERRELADSTLRWVEDYRLLEQRDLAARQQLEAANRKNADQETLRQQAVIEQWNTAATARAALKRLPDVGQSLDRERQAGRALAKRHATLLGGIEWAKRRQEELERELEQTDRRLETMRPHKHIFEQCRAIEAQLEAATDLASQQKSHETRHQKLEQELRRLKQAAEQADKQRAKIQDELETHADATERKRAELRQMDPDKLEQDSRELNRKVLLLKEAEKQLQVWAEKEAALARAAENLETATGQLRQELSKTKALDERAQRADAALNAAQETRDKTHLSLDNWARAARAKLQSGDTCPVCGKTIDEMLTDREFEHIAAPAEQALATARNEAQQARASLQTHHNECRRLKAAVEKQATARDQARAGYDKQQTAALQALTACGYAETAIPHGEWLERQKAALVRQQDDIDRRQADIRRLREDIDRRQERQKELQGQLKAADTGADEAKNKLNAHRAGLEKADTLARECAQQRQAAIKHVDQWWGDTGWQTQWQDNPQGFVERLREDSTQYRQLLEDRDKLDHERTATRQMLERIATNHPAAIDRPADDDAAAIPAKAERLEEAWTDLCAEAASWSARTEAAEQEWRRLNGQVDDFLSAHRDIDRQRLLQLAGTSEDDIRQASARLQAIAAARDEALGAVRACREQRDQLLARRPDGLPEQPDVEQLKASRDALGRQAQALSEQIGAMRQQLDDDRARRLKMGDARQHVAELQQAFDHWELLNRHLGGDRFRRVAQTFILGDLLHKANHFMRRFNDRYALTCQHDSLNILLEDALTGDVSSVNTLSGGEGFMAALALALALAQMNAGRVDVDTIFIDEGFGSLSPAYLERVMATLRDLQQAGGRRVGIISHVEALKETIPTRIQVTREQGGTLSRIAIHQ